jgi:hypothetical protein
MCLAIDAVFRLKQPAQSKQRTLVAVQAGEKGKDKPELARQITLKNARAGEEIPLYVHAI